MYDPLLVSRGAAERSEPKRSPATDISTIPERRAVHFPAQPIAALSQRDKGLCRERARLSL